MDGDRIATLVKLGDTGRTVADPAEDVRGRPVVDCDDNDLGKVEDLLVDSEEGRVRFLRVEHGGILGFGATASFIPVEAVSRVEADRVVIDQSRERVAGAPRYEPDLVDQDRFYDDVYGYYGYLPFWGPGYVYPPYPHYPLAAPPARRDDG